MYYCVLLTCRTLSLLGYSLLYVMKRKACFLPCSSQPTTNGFRVSRVNSKHRQCCLLVFVSSKYCTSKSCLSHIPLPGIWIYSYTPTTTSDRELNWILCSLQGIEHYTGTPTVGWNRLLTLLVVNSGNPFQVLVPLVIATTSATISIWSGDLLKIIRIKGSRVSLWTRSSETYVSAFKPCRLIRCTWLVNVRELFLPSSPYDSLRSSVECSLLILLWV